MIALMVVIVAKVAKAVILVKEVKAAEAALKLTY